MTWKVIKEIATDMPRRLNQIKAADIITQHVKEHCDCLPLSSFDKWQAELKSTFQKDAGAKFIEWNQYFYIYNNYSSKSQSQLVTYFRKNMGLEYMITLKAPGCDFSMKIYTSWAITEFILSKRSGL